MVLTTTIWFLYKATSLKGNKEPKLTMLITGSILSPLLFNIYISDMFYDIDSCDIASYADDNTPYTSEGEVIQKLELIINNLFEWFKNNHMKGNADKCHLLVTRDFDVKNSREEKLLGVKIDTKFSFENHASSLCKKASQKLHALTRVLNFVGFFEIKEPHYNLRSEGSHFKGENV